VRVVRREAVYEQKDRLGFETEAYIEKVENVSNPEKFVEYKSFPRETKLTEGQKIALETAHREMNRKGLVWLDNTAANWRLERLGDDHWRVVILDPGGIYKVKGGPEVAKRAQQLFNELVSEAREDIIKKRKEWLKANYPSKKIEKLFMKENLEWYDKIVNTLKENNMELEVPDNGNPAFAVCAGRARIGEEIRALSDGELWKKYKKGEKRVISERLKNDRRYNQLRKRVEELKKVAEQGEKKINEDLEWIKSYHIYLSKKEHYTTDKELCKIGEEPASGKKKRGEKESVPSEIDGVEKGMGDLGVEEAILPPMF